MKAKTASGETVFISGGSVCSVRVEKSQAVLLDRRDVRVPLEHLIPLEGAVEALTNAVLDQPNDIDPLIHRIRFWKDTHERMLQLADTDEAVRIAPEDDDLYIMRAWCFNDGNSHAAAIRDCNTVLKRDPTNALALTARGFARFRMHEYEMAVSDHSAAIAAQSADPKRYVFLGFALSRLGEIDKALAAYQKSVSLCPDDPDLHTGLAEIYGAAPDARLRDGQKSLHHAKRALELDPKHFASHEAAAIAYAELGDFEAALRHLSRAQELSQAADKKFVDELKLKRELYQAKTPFRFPAVPKEHGAPPPSVPPSAK